MTEHNDENEDDADEDTEIVRPDDWPECEDEPKVDCTIEFANYFNQLACACFTFLRCKQICPDGMEHDPFNGCECLPSEMVRSLYPEWADDDDIKLSEQIGYLEAGFEIP